MARRNRKKRPVCPNCGTELRAEFEFCPHCGQENHDLRVPFKTFLYEFVENITHFDTKLWNTLKVIFSRPGQLTKDYVEGKRAQYVHPARFYIFISVIFFALLTWQVDQDLDNAITTDAATLHKREALLGSVLSDSLRMSIAWDRYSDAFGNVRIPIDKPFYRPTADHLRPADRWVVDSLLGVCADDLEDSLPGTRAALMSALSLLQHEDSLDVCYNVVINGLGLSLCDRADERAFRDGKVDEAELDLMLGEDADSLSWIAKRALLAVAKLSDQGADNRRRLVHSTLKASSVVMFILMPFTALLLLWIFYRDRFYWEHLIFAVHTHTIFFLFFSLLLLCALVFRSEWPDLLGLVLALAMVVYLLRSLRRVYGKSWLATGFRFLLMSIPYFIMFLILMMGGVIWGAINL